VIFTQIKQTNDNLGGKKMKKFFSFIAVAAISVSLVACGGGEEQEQQTDESTTQDENVKLVVGATAVPHAEVLEAAVPLLAEQGIDLEIITFQDYILLK